MVLEDNVLQLNNLSNISYNEISQEKKKKLNEVNEYIINNALNYEEKTKNGLQICIILWIPCKQGT